MAADNFIQPDLVENVLVWEFSFFFDIQENF